MQNVGRAAYREILERWARVSRVDSVKGVATVTTPVEFYPTAVVKCYQTLVDTRCWHTVHERSRGWASIRASSVATAPSRGIRLTETRSRVQPYPVK